MSAWSYVLCPQNFRDRLTDDNLTKAQKKAVMQEIANSINAQLGVKHGNQVAVISTDVKTKDGKEIVGAYHKPSGDIVLNDKNINSTGEAVKGLGHELGHSIGYGEDVAKVMGASLEDYANFGMWNYGSDGQSLASTNSHNGTVDSQGNTIATTGIVTQNFVKRRDNGQLQYELKDVAAGIVSEVTMGVSDKVLNATAGYDPKNLSLKDKADYYTGKEIGGANPVGQVKKGVKKAVKNIVDGGDAAKSKKALNEKINQRGQQKEFEDKIGFKHEKSISGKKANKRAGKGQKEWNDTDIVKEGTLPKGQKPDTISRTHRDKNVPEGPYLSDKTQMKGKTENQLKKEYALPKDGEYNYTTDYKGTKDQKVQIGKTGKNVVVQ